MVIYLIFFLLGAGTLFCVARLESMMREEKRNVSVKVTRMHIAKTQDEKVVTFTLDKAVKVKKIHVEIE